MLNKIIFASNNAKKLEEVRKVLHPMQVASLNDIGFFEDIEETGTSFHENASIKSTTIYNAIKQEVFSDDSGLEVEALNGAPGVYSARYSGKGDQGNIEKLLQELNGKTNRNARFKTVISLIINGKEYFFEGIIEGTIALSASGNKGFGYDPVFIPQGHTKTFAEFTIEEKNRISHRARALQAMKDFLNA